MIESAQELAGSMLEGEVEHGGVDAARRAALGKGMPVHGRDSSAVVAQGQEGILPVHLRA